ncbi:MAG: FxLYD domain-containing protein [Cyanobacteriota bacterium]
MLKSKHLTVALATASILFVAPSAFSRPLMIASDKYPIMPSSDTDKPVCYMQTPDGRTMNLSRLCEKKPSNRPQIAIAEVIYEDDYMVGRVINQSSKTVYQARVNYEVISQNGSVIERGSIATEPQTLSPGQTATFETFMPSDKKVRTTFAEAKEKE